MNSLQFDHQWSRSFAFIFVSQFSLSLSYSLSCGHTFTVYTHDLHNFCICSCYCRTVDQGQNIVGFLEFNWVFLDLLVNLINLIYLDLDKLNIDTSIGKINDDNDIHEWFKEDQNNYNLKVG